MCIQIMLHPEKFSDALVSRAAIDSAGGAAYTSDILRAG